MIYKTLSDLLLDNRRAIEKELKKANTIEEAARVALEAYDWAAKEMLTADAAYKIEHEEWIKTFGESAAECIEEKARMRFKELLTASAEYEYDMERERNVGYSKAEESDGEEET